MEYGTVGNVTVDSMKFDYYHDMRLYKEEQSPKHIDRERTKNNIVFASATLEETYAKLFDDVIAEYNEKQKREERKKVGGGVGYLRELQMKVKEAVAKDNKSKKDSKKRKSVDNVVKPAYQAVVEVGDMFDTSYKDDYDNAKRAEDMLREYFNDFEKRNPSLKVSSAVIHADETKPHLHITFVPVGQGYKTGLSRRVSLQKALGELGFHQGETWEDTPFRQWCESERCVLEDIMRKHGLEPVRKNDPRRRKQTKGEYISSANARKKEVERELHEIVDKKIEKPKKVEANFLGYNTKDDYDKMYSNAVRWQRKALAYEELLERTQAKEKNALIQHIEMLSATLVRYGGRSALERIEQDTARMYTRNVKSKKEKTKKVADLSTFSEQKRGVKKLRRL